MTPEKLNKELVNLEKELRQKKDELWQEYKNKAIENIKKTKIIEILDKHPWYHYSDNLEEGAMGESSENECRREVSELFCSYLKDNEQEFFKYGVVKEFGKNYVKKILGLID